MMERSDEVFIVLYETVQLFLANGQTPKERRYDSPFHGPTKPFGSKIFYHQISTTDKDKLRQFDPKVFKSFLFVPSTWGPLDKSPTRGRYGRIERQHCIRSLSRKNLHGPKHHTTYPSRLSSNFG